MQTYSKTIRKAILPAAFAGLLLSDCAFETESSEQRVDPDIFSENAGSVSEAASGVSDTNATTFSETAAGSNDSDDATPPKATDVIFANAELEYFTPFADPEHSFCLLNEGAVLPVQTQTGNTCWANAAVTSMESSHYLQTGESVTFDAMDIVNNVYFVMPDEEDWEEGLYIRLGEPSFYGGGSLNILATMSVKPINGYLLSDLYASYKGDVESTKQMIRELGAVNMSTHYNQGFFPVLYHGYKTQNYTGDQPNHVVSLVGWDDDFPAEAFSSAAEQNGAWLVQNSLSTGWGNNGYYWMSYASELSGAVYVPTDQYQYAQNHGTYPFEVLNTEDPEVVYAAVYEINRLLGAVGIINGTDETDLSYTIEILDGEFGETLLTFCGSEEMTGYHIAELPEALEVGTCTVVVHKQRNIPVEGESLENAAVTSIQPDRVEYVAKSEPGRSFVLIDGEWVDTTSEEIKELLELDYIPGDVFLPVLYN